MTSTRIRVGWQEIGTAPRVPDVWDGTWEDARSLLLSDLRSHGTDVAASVGAFVASKAAFLRFWAALTHYHEAIRQLETAPPGASFADEINGRKYWLTVEST